VHLQPGSILMLAILPPRAGQPVSLTAAPVLLDALVYAPRGLPAGALHGEVAAALARQLRAARRAAGSGASPAGPAAEPGPEGQLRGAAQNRAGTGPGRGSLTARALHFRPAQLPHAVSAVLPLPLGPEVRAGRRTWHAPRAMHAYPLGISSLSAAMPASMWHACCGLLCRTGRPEECVPCRVWMPLRPRWSRRAAGCTPACACRSTGRSCAWRRPWYLAPASSLAA